jgi:hypothetical protein
MQNNLEKLVLDCQKKYGIIKINLSSSTKGTNGEGIWAVPCTQDDSKIYTQDFSFSEKFNVYICNKPVTWGGLKWGDKITATTNYDSRPFARLEDNPNAYHDKISEDKIKKQLWGIH